MLEIIMYANVITTVFVGIGVACLISEYMEKHKGE